MKLNEVPHELAPVDFLAEVPVIDGVLDPALRDLPRRAFSQVDLFGTAEKPVDAHYRLAYGTNFLYVYVEAQGDRVTYNDRAYQNGDGFHFVIARPRAGDAPSDEFYVAACSAVDRPQLDWSRRLFWYYNVDKLFVPMSAQAKLASAAHDGVISFELLLPWQDLHPYHPWLSDGIGFNLGFVKASGQGAFYYRVLPEDLGGENVPRRYIRLRFAEPVLNNGMQTFVEFGRNHLGQGESLSARAVTLSSGQDSGSENLSIAVLSGEGTGLESSTTEYPCKRGLTFHEFRVNLGDLPPGGYRVAWRSRRDYSRGDDSTRALAVTVLPATAPELHAKRLEDLGARLSPGSATTLRFLSDEAFASLRSLKPYETAAKVRMALLRIEADLSQAEAGRDMFARRTGFLRRAFLSRVDNTLQPYGVRVPAGFDPKAGRRYPLIVFLHGSASDETDLVGFDFLSEGDCIELAPRGRGPSNAFTRDHAQEDIEEAIGAVVHSYPIDEDRIILTGFSMGGYGVYRTFYEHPARYKALAVFSGMPAVEEGFAPGEVHPGFLDDKNLERFRGMPVFIFHGREDRNCPFSVTQELIGKLGRAGASVEFVTEAGAGHQRPGPEALARYHTWLRTVMNN
ncbi:MAG: prolyl oligopeptidase family serine peptidase [Acidobacteriia bacterium]|nr:prolyl oligopeptidase family serine peptidase [Terriglobia bacterium]